MNDKEIIKQLGKSAHRILMTLIVLIICQPIISQEIFGKFYLKKGKEVTNTFIDFQKNNEFSYQSPKHLGEDYGYGHYKFYGDTLKLNFDLTNPKKRSKYSMITKTNESDSISIHFSVYDIDKKEVPHGIITYNLDQTGVLKTNINKYGQAKIKLSKSNKKLDFTHFKTGYEQLKVNIIPNKDYSISIYLDYSLGGKSIEDVIWLYKLKKSKKKVLILKNDKGQSEIWKKKC